ARGIDLEIALLVPPAPDRIVVLEPEAHRVHQAMALRAARILAVLREALARREGRIQVRWHDHEVGRRRGQLLTEEALAHELPAMNRGRLVRLRVEREERRLGDDAGVPSRVDVDLLEAGPARRRQSVEGRELGVDERVRRGEERLDAAVAPEDV